MTKIQFASGGPNVWIIEHWNLDIVCFLLFGPKLSDSIDIRALTGGDKPRPYNQKRTQRVGAGFIPARLSA